MCDCCSIYEVQMNRIRLCLRQGRLEIINGNCLVMRRGVTSQMSLSYAFLLSNCSLLFATANDNFYITEKDGVQKLS